MRKFYSIILGIAAITIVSFPGLSSVTNVQAAGSYPDVVVLMDRNTPTNHQFIAGQRHEGVARFLLAADSADALIASVDIKTTAWDAIFKMAMPWDGEYQKPALYNETDGQFLDYEFSNLSWGSATVNFITPLVIRSGETKAIRVDATVKQGVSGSAKFNLTNIIFRNTAGVKSYLLPSSSPEGNTFTVTSGTTRIVPTLSITANSAPQTVPWAASHVELGSFVLKANDGPINATHFWLISDTPDVENAISSLYIEDQDGIKHNKVGGFPLSSLSRLSSISLLATGFFNMDKAIFVPAGESRSFKVKGNLNFSATGKIRLGIGGAGFTDFIEDFNGATKLGGSWPVFASPITISANSSSTPNQSVFYLNFDNQLSDASGRSAQTVGNSAGIIYGAGVKGQAVKFTGYDSYAEYSCANVVDEKKGSVEAMIKFDQAYGEDAVIWHTNDSRYVLYYDKASTNVQRNIIARAGQEYAATGSGPAIYSFDQYFADPSYSGKRDKLALGAWHHLVMTWEGSPSGTVKLYVDGQLLNTNKYVSTAPCKTFRVGNNYWPGVNWENGWIDEIKVYTRALGGDEVKTNYQAYGLGSETPKVTPAPTAKPDFTVYDITLLEGASDKIYAFVKVRNIGAESAPGKLHVSVANETTGKVETFDLDGPFHKNFNGSFNFTLGPIKNTASYYRVTANVDTGENFAESNESNNTLTKTFNIAAQSNTVVADPVSAAPAVAEPVADTGRRAQLLADNKIDSILAELNTLRNKVREQEVELKHLRALTKGLTNVTQETTQSATDFIAYGVDTNTKKLGEGERASVVYSYKQAFGKLPETENDVADMIKIANGHWPSERNLAAEASAAKSFAAVYKRQPNTGNARDNAAVMIMAYGLRQTASNRNLASERVGIKNFVSIYGHVPANIGEWNIMQAITYSGAKR